MPKSKIYLSNEELKSEILKCINKGYADAVSCGFSANLPPVDESDPEELEKYNNAINLGYVPERSEWIQRVREYSSEKLDKKVKSGEICENDAVMIRKQMAKPVVSDNLARMFQLIVNNVAKSFYWANPDDGDDCKSNALLDLCSNFWKFEPVDMNGRLYNAFAFCTQIAYFGIAGAHRILHPKKYSGTISMSFLDSNNKSSDLYNI